MTSSATRNTSKHRLTDAALKKSAATGKLYRLLDGDGIYAEVSAKGSISFYLNWRRFGKANRTCIGKFPVVSLAAARKRADEIRAELWATGNNPNEARRREAEAVEAQAEAVAASVAGTFAACAERYMARNEPRWSATHAERNRYLLKAFLLPAWSSEPIADINSAAMLKLMDGIVASGRIETAKKAFQVFSAILATAIIEGHAANDWTGAYVKAGMLPKQAIKHFAAVTDPAELGALLRAASGYAGESVRNALLMTVHTFQRHGDVRSMKWADVDLDAGLWTFAISKTRQQHTVPLSRQMVELLRRQQDLHCHSVYAFPCARSRTRPLSESACRAALRSMGFDKETITPHGFRATARTLLDEVLRERVELVEHQLGHAVRDPLGRAYNRTTYLAERVAMMQRYSDYLEALQ